MSDRTPSNSRLHWLAAATVVAMFPLICLGGLTTSHKAGMSVPDWPNSYGYNMFLFPPSQWVGGILYEHTHRLMGTVVGFLAVLQVLSAWGPAATARGRKVVAIGGVLTAAFALMLGLVLVVFYAARVVHEPAVKARTIQALVGAVGLLLVFGAAWFCRRPEPSRRVRWLSVAVLLGVIVQGTIGGLRVVLVDLDLAIVHGCVAQAVFCLAGLMALVTSPHWATLPDLRHVARPPLLRWSVATVVVVYAQLIVGATMRHNDAGLAIPDLPLSYGRLIPPTDEGSLEAANLERARSGSPDLKPVTLDQVWLHAGHRAGAVLVTVVATVTIVTAFRRRREAPFAVPRATLLAALLVAQVTLGVLTVLLHKPADVASAHVAVGALVLLTSFVLAARCVRAYRLGPARSGAATKPAAGVSATGRPPVDRQNDPSVALTPARLM
ncbi:MAG TPA: COX15/CtaA family protein [Humisphaera sp.]